MAGYSVATYQLTDSQFPVLPVSVMYPHPVHQQAVIDRKLINPQQEIAYKTSCSPKVSASLTNCTRTSQA